MLSYLDCLALPLAVSCAFALSNQEARTVRDLSNKEAAIRLAAAKRLAESNVILPIAAPALVGALCDEDFEVRRYVREALIKMGKNSVPALIDGLQSPNEKLRAQSAGVLAEMGSAAASAVEALLLKLKDRDSFVRREASRALGEAGIGSASCIAGLIGVLSDKDENVREAAATSLGDLGPSASKTSASKAAEALRAALADKDPDVKCRAAEALGRIGIHSPEIVSRLRGLLSDKSNLVRVCAADALPQLDSEDSTAVPWLMTALQDRDAMVRVGAARALGHHGLRAKTAIKSLSLSLKDPDALYWAAVSLTKIGPAAKEEVPALVEASRQQGAYVRAIMAAALLEIEPTKQQFAHMLLNSIDEANGLLHDYDDPELQSFMVNCLGKLGPHAKEALPALRELAKSRHALLRKSSRAALRKINNE